MEKSKMGNKEEEQRREMQVEEGIQVEEERLEDKISEEDKISQETKISREYKTSQETRISREYKTSQEVELEEAIRRICQVVSPLPAVRLDLENLAGEILAGDIFASRDQPPFPRSPLDGYAFRGEDSRGASRENPVRLRVLGKVYAGDERNFVVHSGEAVRLMTGARIPEGADAVIRQEDTDLGEDQAALYREIRPYENYCFQGEDFKRGDRLLKAGTSLDFAAAAVLASNGTRWVQAVRKPMVAVISTGEELAEPGKELGPGKIYDCNRFLLCARLRELGIPCRGVSVGDGMEAVRREIERQLERADAVITTGGVSVGERDMLNQVLPALGAEILFSRLRMKPGSPSKFALVQGKPVLALSGNPFAASAVFELLGRPLLDSLTGSDRYAMKREQAVFQNGLKKSSSGRRFLRGIYRNGEVHNPEGNSSGQISSLLGCNCLIDIPAGSGPVLPGSQAELWMF